jgi:hypothetical protein
MLHDRELSKNLALIHLHHSLIHFVPVDCICDAVKNLRVLKERARLHLQIKHGLS